MTDYMNNRIEKIMEVYNLSASQLADKLGIQRSGLSHILSGRNRPGLDFAIKVLEKFPDINPDWLLLGRNVMLRKDSMQLVKTDTLEGKTITPGNSSLDLFSDLTYKTTEPNKANDPIVNNSKPENFVPSDNLDKNGAASSPKQEENQDGNFKRPTTSIESIEKIILVYDNGKFEVLTPKG